MRKFQMLLLGALLLSMQLFAQNRTVTGRVLDAQGNGIPGASVTISGSKIGATTGNDGSFSVSVPSSAKTLTVSSVGYTQSQLTIGSGNSLMISLTPLDQALENVVITVPYGTVKKSSFTGSENTIGAKTLDRQKGVTSVTRALEGQVPGVIATNGGGAPGTGA